MFTVNDENCACCNNGPLVYILRILLGCGTIAKDTDTQYTYHFMAYIP